MSSLDDFFPGSRTPRSAPEPAVTGAPSLPDASEGWDANPTIMSLNGVETEFFTIGALAHALNRQVVTIRKWERLGFLPKATYRTSGGRKDRLYTRAQVEGLVALAVEEKVYDPGIRIPIDTTNFPSRAASLFVALAEAA